MHARERTRAALLGTPPDRPPLVYQFLGGAPHVLEHVGARMGQAYRDADRIAQTQVAAAELFGHDAGMVPWGCLTVEAEAFGCQIEWLDDYYPRVVSHPLEAEADLGRLVEPDPGASGRMPLVLDALARLRERAGNDLFIIAMVVSPFLVAAELRGMVPLLSDFVIRPSFADDLLSRVCVGTERYVTAIARQGAADAIMFENAGASRELMGPMHVERFVMPYERRLIGAIRRAEPDLLVMEHNCSQQPFVDEVLALDIDVAHVANADQGLVRTSAKAHLGTVDNQRLLLEGAPAEIERVARAQIEENAGTAFVLSTSCEIPLKAPLHNIQALASALG